MVALLGDNGAGKTTLVKILSGVDTADSGDFQINSIPVDLKAHTVSMARHFGIETVHQDRALGEKQAIWRNFFMGRHLKGFLGTIPQKKEQKETLKVLGDILGLDGVGLSPEAPVSVLSGGERQGLAIGRAIYFNSKIILLDEPCTALAVNEVNKVLSFIKKIRDNHKSAIFISHNISHAYEVCDRFVFMNHGKIAAEFHASNIDIDGLTQTLITLSNME